MSETPQRDPQQPPDGSRRPSRWRRLARLAIALTLLVLGSIVVALVLVHTPVGRSAVQGFLERSVGPAMGAELRMGSLHYRLWAGTLDAAALRLTWEGTVLEVAEAHVRWSPHGGLRLRLVRPNLVLRDTGKPKPLMPATGLSARPWTALERIGRAEIAAGRIEMRDLRGAPYLVLDPIDATLQEHAGRRAIQITLQDGVVLPPGGRSRPQRLSGRADLHLGGSSLVIDAVHLATKGSTADFHGALDRLQPNEGTASVLVDADAALAALVSPDSDLSGRIHAQADLQVKDSLSGWVRISSPALTVQGVGPWDTSLRGRVASSRMVVEWAEALGYGGRFTAKGPISLDARSPTDLVLRAEDVDAATLARATAGADLPVRSRLDANLRWTTTGWDLDRARGEGDVTLRPLAVPTPRRSDAAPGLPLSGSTKLVVEGRRVQLRELRLEAHDVLVAGDLALSPTMGLQGRYRAELPLESLPSLAADLGTGSSLPALVGRLVAEGEIGGKAKDPVATVRLRGEGVATAAAARSGTAALEGDGRYAGGRLTLEPLVVRSSGGGQAVLWGGVPLTAEGGEWDLRGDVRSLDLAPLLAASGIDGRGPLDGHLQATGPRAQPTARADLDARVALAGAREPIEVSLSGSSTGTLLAVERLEAVLAGGRVQGKGSLDSRSGAIAASATAEGLRLSRLPMLPASLRGLDGTLAASLALSGRTDAPAGEMHAAIGQATFGESPLPGVTLTARADGQRLDVIGAIPDPARPGDESVFLRGGGSLQGDWPLRLQVDSAALPLQSVLDAIPATRRQGAALAAQGTVTIDVALRRPRALRYASDRLVASGRVLDVEWKTEPFRIEGATDEATVTGLRLTATSSSPASPPPDRERTTGTGSERAAPGALPGVIVARARANEQPAEAASPRGAALAGGTFAIDGRIAIAPTRSFDLAIEGGLDLAMLQRFTDSRVAGAARMRLRVRGTAADPDLQGELAVTDGRARYGPVRVSGLQILARLQGAQAGIERFEALMLGGRLTARGALPLRPLPAGTLARLHFEATGVDLSRLAISGSQRETDAPSFLVSLVGDLEASAPDLGAVRGRGRFTRAEQQSPEGRIALSEPAEWTLERGRFEQAPLRLVGPLGTLEVRGEARVAGGPLAGSAVIAGPIDLRTVGPFLADTTLAGPARIDLRASWDPKGVRLDGGLTVENGRMTLEQLAFTLSQLKGEVRLLGDHATVDATAASGDGRLVLSGGMTFGPRLLGPAQLRLDAQRVLINYPEGFRARAGGTVSLSGDPGTYRIKGEIGLTQAYYTAEFDQKKQSLDRLEWQLAALQGGESVGESLPLSVRVQLVEPLRIRNNRARLDVVGEFTATGTLAQPTAAGQVSLLEGGEIRIRRGDVRIQQGRVELNGYPAGNPELDVTGISQIAGIEMDVRARGTLEDLQLDITSSNRPDLSQTDLVSLLLTGRTAQNAAAQSTAIVAEELASALGGVIQKNVGELLLVDVGPERSLLTDDVDPTQRFNLGARLRQDLIVLYSTRLDGTEQRWIVEWNPRGGRLRLRAMYDQRQVLSFEVTDRISFNVFRRDRAAQPEPRELSKLAAFRIEGDTPIPPDELMKVAALKIGRGESALRREQAADKVRSRLVRDGWRGATVDTESAPAAGDPRSVELTLRVSSGPHILISWTGDDPGKGIRTKAIATWPAYASPESAAAVVARTAHVLLQADRYYLSKVEHEVRQHEGETELVLRIERGPRGKGVALDFEGNTVLGDDALRKVLPKPGSRAFFEALEGRANRVSGALRIAYAQVGHLRTRVLRPRSGFDAATGRLHVVVPIRERGASRVSELVLPQELKDAGVEAPPFTLHEGQPFDLDAYIADRDAIAAWYRNAGWMEARVRGVLEPAGDDLRVRFEVAPGPRLRAGQIRIESHGRSKAAMIRRAVVVEPGATIRPRELSESRARLSELGVFRSVDVRPVPLQEIGRVRKAAPAAGAADGAQDGSGRAGRGGGVPDGARAGAPAGAGGDAPEERPDGTSGAARGAGSVRGPREGVSDIVVSYVERPDITLEYGLRYSSSGSVGVVGAPSSPDNGRLQIAGALELANPLGWGWRLRPYALLTTDRHTLGTALESATLFGLRVRTQLLVFDDNDNRDSVSSLASRIRGVSLQQTRALVEDTSSERRHDRLRLQWGYADKRIQYLDRTGVETSLAGKRCYLSLSLAGDERDSLTDPHRGLFWTASSELARTAFGSDVNYVRLYGQLFLYLPLPGRMVWAQGYRAGVAPGKNPVLLLENRFQAGGPTTVRGYYQNDLGPQTPDGIGLGGQGVVILNQELRFPIWKLVSGGVFWDAGNVWETAGDVSLDELRQSVGVGLRVMFPFGPVRVEYAWKVGPNRSGRTGRFVFGLGHAF